MLTKLKKSNSKGFTIIEVMIVLAIAGLIILIVLLAVPALQRNGRNTAIKQDAAAIAGGIGEFASNNDGARPDGTSACSTGSVTLKAAGKTDSVPKIQGSTNATCTAPGAPAVTTPKAGELLIQFGMKCPDPIPVGLTITPILSNRSTAVIYATEAAGGLQARCLDT